jgi:hypothetical protein
MKLDNLKKWANFDGSYWACPYHSFDDQLVFIQAQEELQTLIEPLQGEGYWRATNRETELNDVRRGVEIISRNHTENTTEDGMSVCETLAYAAFGYRYVYRVDGEVVGYGSDGEPVLRNVRVLSDLFDANEAINNDEQQKKTQVVYRQLAAELNIGVQELIALHHHVFV